MSESNQPIAPAVGQRKLFYFNNNGQPAYQIYDLTPDDFMNPQPGDEFFNGEAHDRAVRSLASMLRYHYRYSPTVSTHIKPKIVWRDASLAQPMPDVVLVNHLNDPQRHRPVLNLTSEKVAEQALGPAPEEVTVRAIFEVTSPLLAQTDLEDKRVLYARANVPEYWIIDTGLRPDQEQLHYTILGFQLDNEEYKPIPDQSSGRWESSACRLWITISSDHQNFQLGDLRTGKALPEPAEDDNPSIATQSEADRSAQSIASQLKLSP
jgi:hypothetical protein